MKKNSEAKRNQRIYLVSGIVILLVSIYINMGYIARGDFPEGIVLVAVGINQLCLAYLSPHIFPKDERARLIREKAMNVNYFVTLGIIITLIFIVGSIELSAYHALVILGSFSILSVVFLMIFFSKRI
jgi:hypothetical protein